MNDLNLSFLCPDEAALAALAARLAPHLAAGDLLCLDGPLGSGKTSLARALIRARSGDAALEVPSPTFTLLQHYDTPDGLAIWHSDLYRLEAGEAVYELGLEEALDHALTLVEWPDRLPPRWRAEALQIRLEIAGTGRRITLAGGPRWRNRLAPRAIILAAGRGTRMKPFTESRPKALIPVAGRTLLDYNLAAVARSEVLGPAAVVNVHSFADQMIAHLAPLAAVGRVFVSDERAALLETGGGVRKALPVMADRPFAVINADVIRCDRPDGPPWLDVLAAAFDLEHMDVLLTIAPTASVSGFPPSGDLVPLADIPPAPGGARAVRLREGSEAAPMVYAAAMITHPRAYQDTPEGAFSNLLLFRRAAAAGRLWGLAYPGRVLHVGTPDALRRAEALLAENPPAGAL